MVSYQIDGLVLERRNTIASALKLRLFCTKPSKCKRITRITLHHYIFLHTALNTLTQNFCKQFTRKVLFVLYIMCIKWMKRKHKSQISFTWQWFEIMLWKGSLQCILRLGVRKVLPKWDHYLLQCWKGGQCWGMRWPSPSSGQRMQVGIDLAI